MSIVSVTFCGDCAHVNEKDIDRVYVDKSYNQNTDALPHEKVIWVDTLVPYDDQNEIINRRKRIRRMLQFILLYENADYIIITDADVVIPKLRDKVYLLQLTQYDAVFFCYPAYIKDARYIDIYCKGTNFVLRGSQKQKVLNLLDKYDPQQYPIDMYIHDNLNITYTIVPGTKHYIFGKPYIL